MMKSGVNWSRMAMKWLTLPAHEEVPDGMRIRDAPIVIEQRSGGIGDATGDQPVQRRWLQRPADRHHGEDGAWRSTP